MTGFFPRQNLPNLMNLMATIFIFGVVIYFQVRKAVYCNCSSNISLSFYRIFENQ
jgi:hypothetical protein